VREKILFALHNVLRDPPFSRLDLVSVPQPADLSRSHRAASGAGEFPLRALSQRLSLLGSSESADSMEDLFSVVDKKHRIYRAKAIAQPRRPSLLPPVPPPGQARESAAEEAGSALIPARRNFSFSALHQRVLEQYAPPSIIVNRDSKIVHMSETSGVSCATWAASRRAT